MKLLQSYTDTFAERPSRDSSWMCMQDEFASNLFEGNWRDTKDDRFVSMVRLVIQLINRMYYLAIQRNNQSRTEEGTSSATWAREMP